MTQVAHNAEDLQHALHEARANYEKTILPALRDRTRGEENRWAGIHEFHVRVYLINQLLAALGWRIGVEPDSGLPNLVPESSIRSLTTKNIRRLDYLGVERDTRRPLLIVETKHPRLALPIPRDNGTGDIRSLLADEKHFDYLPGEWKDTLKQLGDYVNSINPKGSLARAVVTNGEWLVVFRNPAEFFVDGPRDAKLIDVFQCWAALSHRAGEVLRVLGYRWVTAEVPTCDVAEILFLIEPSSVECAARGLLVLHVMDLAVVGGSRARTEVSPVIFLGTRAGTRLCVQSGVLEQMPARTDGSEISAHLRAVGDISDSCVQRIQGRLGKELNFMVADDELRALDRTAIPNHVVVTGPHHHFLRLDTPARCVCHDWQEANARRVASSRLVPTQTDRALFPSRDLRHCAHREVEQIKRHPPLPGKRTRQTLGVSPENTFCRIWGFEQSLCCRSCTFLEACGRRAEFQLPCAGDGIA